MILSSFLLLTLACSGGFVFYETLFQDLSLAFGLYRSIMIVWLLCQGASFKQDPCQACYRSFGSHFVCCSHVSLGGVGELRDERLIKSFVEM